MPVWAAMAATLSYNLHRHLNGRSTLCSTARTILPAPILDAALVAGTVWLHFHYRAGFTTSPKEH